MRFNQVLLWKIYGKLIKEIILTLMIYFGIQLWMLFGFYIKQCMLKGMEHMIKILLIEDDTMIASGICYALEMEGYETCHVTTIADTRKLVGDNKFDLAIIDMQATVLRDLEPSLSDEQGEIV